jgi:alkanesulfonate monooxygenase SsuD/methylene tetrahydromethanopterin reductase-like flavin-dependent oxidoreductase (luciferase family)
MPTIALGIPVGSPDVRPNTPMVFGKRADEVGAHSVWMIDHIPFPSHEALISLAGIAGATTQVCLGMSVLVGALRPPLLLAKMLATLDNISNGRVIAGLGLGGRKDDFDAANVPFDQRGPRLAETMKLLRMSWTGEPIKYDGPFWQYDLPAVGPVPIQKPLPIYLGGSADPALKRIAESADGYVASSGAGLPGFTRRVQKIRDYAEEIGRDPGEITIIGVVYGCVDPSRERAYQLAATYAEHYYGPGVRDLENNYFLGDASEGERFVEAFVNAGADVVCLSNVTADPRNLDYLSEQLLPRVMG